MPLPRGIVNANPGNIRKGPAPWQGQIVPGKDQTFCQFSQPQYGIRAIMVLLKRYYYVLGLTNLTEIINRWAPPGDHNNTATYIRDVANQMKVDPLKPLFMCPETYISFAQAIAVHENGRPPTGTVFAVGYPPCWYDQSVYQDAYNLTVPNGVQAS